MEQYAICEGCTPTVLWAAVRAMLQAGWQLQGGVAVLATDCAGGRVFYQALSRVLA